MVGGDDGEYPDICRYMVDRAVSQGRDNIQLEQYPGAGHLIDLPHSPSVHQARHPYVPPHVKIHYGGQVQLHCLAQIRAWEHLLNFYMKHLKL